jgi:hypothetical protein
MGSSKESTLLLHTTVRWLSRGIVVFLVFTLQSEILFFGANRLFQLSNCPRDTVSIHRLAYIFTKINELNLPFQGATVTVISQREETDSCFRKMQLWRTTVEKLSDFSGTERVSTERGCQINEQIKLN